MKKSQSLGKLGRLLVVGTLLATAMMFNQSANASPDNRAPNSAQEYHFKFKLNSESFEYTQASKSYEEAYERAAKACFNHFKNGQHLSEEKGLDIIDVCANPRS